MEIDRKHDQVVGLKCWSVVIKEVMQAPLPLSKVGKMYIHVSTGALFKMS